MIRSCLLTRTPRLVQAERCASSSTSRIYTLIALVSSRGIFLDGLPQNSLVLAASQNNKHGEPAQTRPRCSRLSSYCYRRQQKALEPTIDFEVSSRARSGRTRCQDARPTSRSTKLVLNTASLYLPPVRTTPGRRRFRPCCPSHSSRPRSSRWLADYVRSTWSSGEVHPLSSPEEMFPNARIVPGHSFCYSPVSFTFHPVCVITGNTSGRPR